MKFFTKHENLGKFNFFEIFLSYAKFYHPTHMLENIKFAVTDLENEKFSHQVHRVVAHSHSKALIWHM